MSVEHALAQLRHLYGHMVNGRVADAGEAARGLLGPAISVLEKQWTALEKERNAAIADNAAMNIALRVTLKTLGKSVVTGEDVHEARKYAAGSLSSPHPGAALLEEHRKALVRVRNEGLEKAAMKAREMGRTFRADGMQRRGASGDALLMAASCASDIANAIDALKEPES